MSYDFAEVRGRFPGCCVAAGGAALYEAAVGLKELIRGRAVLLVANRTDIVDAVEADGVALTSKGESAKSYPHDVSKNILSLCLDNTNLLTLTSARYCESKTAFLSRSSLAEFNVPTLTCYADRSANAGCAADDE